jgi:hypothetical protein
MSFETAMRLVEFERARQACDTNIDTPAKLESEIKRALIYSIALQSPAFLGGGSPDPETVKLRAMEEYYSNPHFKAVIDMQCMELMKVFQRYEPR